MVRAKPPPLQAFGIADIGLRRTEQEDSFASLPDAGLFVVADGMGGHAGGATASDLVVRTLVAQISAIPFTSRFHAVASALGQAQAAVLRGQREIPGMRGMGSTVVLLAWTGAGFLLAHMGDSRCYRLRGTQLQQLTRDHSMANQGYPELAHQLTAAMGHSGTPSFKELDATPGDQLLLCSDGVTNMVPDATIGRVLSRDETPRAQASQLIALANDAGGADNSTAIVVHVQGPTRRPTRSVRR